MFTVDRFGQKHEVTAEDLRTEEMESIIKVVEAAEAVNDLYNAHLRGRVFDSKAFDKLRRALSLQSRALMQLRGPDHDPHPWIPGEVYKQIRWDSMPPVCPLCGEEDGVKHTHPPGTVAIAPLVIGPLFKVTP